MTKKLKISTKLNRPYSTEIHTGTMTTEIDTVRRRHEILDETHVSDENVGLL